MHFVCELLNTDYYNIFLETQLNNDQGYDIIDMCFNIGYIYLLKY